MLCEMLYQACAAFPYNRSNVLRGYDSTCAPSQASPWKAFVCPRNASMVRPDIPDSEEILSPKAETVSSSAPRGDTVGLVPHISFFFSTNSPTKKENASGEHKLSQHTTQACQPYAASAYISQTASIVCFIAKNNNRITQPLLS